MGDSIFLKAQHAQVTSRLNIGTKWIIYLLLDSCGHTKEITCNASIHKSLFSEVTPVNNAVIKLFVKINVL